ncbi:MAG TPA: carboxypeptidase regulatory-like domain-containing protein [Chthonomonadaceae bacterium]|nr:carboxypeptidase regulatory-like domain-containing protein [Chthonomonadaceae bacterium]
MRRGAFILLGLLLGAWAGTLFAIPASAPVEITGQILLEKGVAHEAVIYLEGSQKSQPLAKAVVDQRNKAFVPHVSVVTKGTIIQFPNNDTVFHNVFAYYQAKKFDLGMYPRGAVKTVTFDKPGLVALLCNVHSDMSAYIMVVDTPYYAVTDKQGKFRIANVPPGAYTVHAWHETGAETTQTLTVAAGAQPLNLTLKRK